MHRYRSEARQHALTRSVTVGEGLLPTYDLSNNKNPQPNTIKAGGLDSNNACGPSLGPTATGGERNGDPDHIRASEKPAFNKEADHVSSISSASAAPPIKSEATGAGNSAIVTTDGPAPKPSIPQRMTAGCKRFGVHLKNALFYSKVNTLLVAVPVGIIVKAIGLNSTVVFSINAVAIIPLAGLLAYATESVAKRLGDTWGALLNVSFGNAVELIIFIIALAKGEIRIVQASILGSILANLLLILGMAFLLGGLRFREQIYNSTVTQMSACLLSLSVASLILPTAFYASFNDNAAEAANTAVLKVSRATSVVLLVIYVLYLLFQLKSHAYMYESTPQAVIDEESHPGVLADIMNGSSSSSDDSSSTDSSDSDTSGSVITTTKRVRRMFKNRRRRKSSATSITTSRTPSIVASISPPIGEQRESYWDHARQSHGSTSQPRLGVIASGDEADLDAEDGTTSPRIRDFGNILNPAGGRTSPEHAKRRKRHFRRKHKKRHHRDTSIEHVDPLEKDVPAMEPAAPPATSAEVGEVDDLTTIRENANSAAPGRLGFNMRQFSSRVQYRPALPKVLSNNVFVQPSPYATPAVRPSAPIRSVSAGNTLRRTSSLPDRLNEQFAATNTNTANRTGPLPPYQHQRVHFNRPGLDNPEHTVEIEEDDEKPNMSRTAAVVLLLCTTALVAICAEFMVDAIPEMIANSSVSQAFIGLIILPIVGNAAEHVTAVTVACRNKMDLAIGVAVGSSIQIALFVTPLVVLLGWILKTDMSLYFNLFETVSLIATAFVINFLILDGRSNYLEGALLIAVYVIIAVVAFFYPSSEAESLIGGAGGPQ